MAKFEDNLTALETVVDRLERGDLSLEASVQLFEEGLKLSGACKVELEAAEGRIQLLVDRGRGPMAVSEMNLEQAPSGEEQEER